MKTLENVTLYNADCFEVLPTIPDDSVDMVFTDPPYWTLDRWREVGTTTRLGGNADPKKRSGWFKTIGPDAIEKLVKECFRVLKPNRHAFIMCDGQTLRYVLNCAAEYFNYYKPLVWDKVKPGMGYHFRASHEYIVMVDKGKNLICKDRTLKDIISIPAVSNSIFPTQKPVELAELFVENFTDGGWVVLDPFLGSGTTGIACVNLKRQFIGIELDAEYFSKAESRIREAENNLQHKFEFAEY